MNYPLSLIIMIKTSKLYDYRFATTDNYTYNYGVKNYIKCDKN